LVGSDVVDGVGRLGRIILRANTVAALQVTRFILRTDSE
jgi:hypothetical protein